MRSGETSRTVTTTFPSEREAKAPTLPARSLFSARLALRLAGMLQEECAANTARTEAGS